MKKIGSLLLIMFFAFRGFGQLSRSFEKPDWVLTGGRSLAVFQTRITAKATGEQELSAAAAGVWDLGIEKAVMPWLSLGFSWRGLKYLTEADQIGGIKPDVFGRDYSLFSNFHWLRKKRFDGVAGIAFGFSEFLFRTNDPNDAAAYGTGSSFQVFLKPRWFFYRHYGFFMQLGYNYTNYNSVRVWDKFTDEKDFLKIEGSGAYLGVGLNFNFGRRAESRAKS